MDANSPELKFRVSTDSDADYLYALIEETMRPYIEATYGHWNADGARGSQIPRLHRAIFLSSTSVTLGRALLAFRYMKRILSSRSFFWSRGFNIEALVGGWSMTSSRRRGQSRSRSSFV